MYKFIIFFTIFLSHITFAQDGLDYTTIEGHVYDAAIIVKEYGDYQNLSERSVLLSELMDICYNGDFDTAYLILLELADNLEISDEFKMDEMIQKDNSIILKVFDLYAFRENYADFADKDEYMDIYIINSCQ
jgi:hypothetical protein